MTASSPQPAQSIERCVFVRVAVGWSVDRHVRDRVHRSTTSNDHLTDSDDLRSDVANAMNTDQLSAFLKEDQFQQAPTAGDGTAGSACEVRAANLVVETPVTALLFRQPCSRNLRHAVDSG